jgi:hypothetical protein
MPEFRVLAPSPADEPAARRRKPVPKRKPQQRQPWWTKERVIAGLRAFYRDHGIVVTATAEWQELTRGGGNGPGRRYPSFYGVLKHFRTFREAWTAAGVAVDRVHEEWSEVEDWYLREAAGILSREEIARDLKRSPDAVHRRLYDLGLNSYQAHGWSMNRVCQATGLDKHRIERYMLWKRIEWTVGTKSFYFRPEDLVVIEEIDWTRASQELGDAVRRGLMAKLIGLLERRRRAVLEGIPS